MNAAEGYARCIRIAEGTEDVPADELAQFRSLVAREAARAEARRRPSPQLQLDQAA